MVWVRLEHEGLQFEPHSTQQQTADQNNGLPYCYAVFLPHSKLTTTLVSMML